MKKRSIITTLLLLLAIGLLMVPAASATVTFNDDFESGTLANNNVLTQLGAASPSVVTSPVYAGSYAASMTIAHTQERSELQPTSGGFTIKEQPGTSAWFGDSIYLTTGFPTTATGCTNCWQTVMQWKDDGGTVSGSPPVELTVKNGNYVLHGGFSCPGGANEFSKILGTASTGSWTRFIFQISFNTAANGGWVSAWDGATQILNQYAPPCGTVYPAPNSQYDTLRLGYYRDPNISATGTVVHDSYKVGTTMADVQ